MGFDLVSGPQGTLMGTGTNGGTITGGGTGTGEYTWQSSCMNHMILWYVADITCKKTKLNIYWSMPYSFPSTRIHFSIII